MFNVPVNMCFSSGTIVIFGSTEQREEICKEYFQGILFTVSSPVTISCTSTLNVGILP